MKFLADECCDTGLVASLRDDGHDVLYILGKNQVCLMMKFCLMLTTKAAFY